MAAFSEHIQQAKWNLKFLEETNSKSRSFWDWQVTTSFYVAVHVVNAHLAQVANLHYRSHEDVKNAINPYQPLALGQIDLDVYLAYVKLEGFSRRSRYLCHDNMDDHSIDAHLTYDKHFTKAIKKLDQVLIYFADKYSIPFPITVVKSPDLAPRLNLKFFSV